MTDFTYTYTQKGWECPKCGRVYSPITCMCFYCGNQKTNTSGGSGSPDNEVWKPSSIGENASNSSITGYVPPPVYGGTGLCKHSIVAIACPYCEQERIENK